MRAVILALLAGCARPAALPADVPSETPHDATRYFTIWLGGSRVGTAIESERWRRDGVHLHREEQLAFLRGDADVQLTTAIDIDADAALVARKVRWSERNDRDERAAEAIRQPHGWQVSSGEQLGAAAVPAELVPLIVRRDGSFTGSVFLPARGFVTGSGRIEPVAPGRLVARLVLEAGPTVEATIDLDADGMPARIVDGEGVIAIRASESQAAAAFPSVDLLAATAISIGGTRANGRSRIRLDGNLALPAVPGQQAWPVPAGVDVDLDPSLTGELPPGPAVRDRSGEITSLVAAVRRRITPDLGASRTSSRDVAAATAGDCTTFALAYAALAGRRAIPTRVVTGLRVDGGRLVRHRWAVSWTGTRWIAIDAAFGAVPAGGNLIGLAVHDADDAGLVAGEAALTQVHAATWD